MEQVEVQVRARVGEGRVSDARGRNGGTSVTAERNEGRKATSGLSQDIGEGSPGGGAEGRGEISGGEGRKWR